MEGTKINLQPADSVEVVILADNVSDVLLPGGPNVIRPPLAKNGVIPTNALLAEHGLCLLITVTAGQDSHSFLLDTGYSNLTVPHNLNFLNVSIKDIEAVILSHGHMDHTGGMKEVLEMAGGETKVVVHPDAFLKRTLNLPTGDEIMFPDFPSREKLVSWGADIIENTPPMLLGDDTILVTGEVARTTSFEKGMPGTKIIRNGKFEPDNFADDQSLVINLPDKGLVIISGCAHAGIINSIEYAKALTGQEKIHAVIGGFHLSGAAMAPNVEPTIEKLKQIPMDVICPMHCTGIEVALRIGKELSCDFIQSSVGSKIILK